MSGPPRPSRDPGLASHPEAALELASAVKEEYPGIEIESRHGGTGEVRRAPAESVCVINPSSPTF